MLVGLAVGTVLLGWAMSLSPGDSSFYPATILLGLAWSGAALLAGPLHLFAPDDRGIGAVGRGVRRGVLTGLGLVAVFAVGGLVVREVSWLDRQVEAVADLARDPAHSSAVALVLVTAFNALAEELFFRNALYESLRRHPVAWTTTLYAAVTAASGNPMLVFAAILLGTVVGAQRRATGGVLAPILTHCTWSTAMIFLLPALFG